MFNKKLFILLNEYHDDSDPGLMDKILSYLEDIHSEDDEFMEILVDKLRDQVITWKQPWYQNSFSLTRNFKAHGDISSEMYRTDKVTKRESDLIDSNWNKLVEAYDIPNKPISFARWRQKDHSSMQPHSPTQLARLFVTSYLAQGLERTLNQVYKHVICRYACPVKGYYHPDEERIMEIVFQNQINNPTVYLSLLLGREPRGIYNKQHISNGYIPEKRKVKWTLELATKCVNLLLQYTGKRLKKLRNTFIDKEIWIQIQNEMDIPYANIRYFWLRRLHPQLFIKEKVKLRSLRKTILRKLRSSAVYDVWGDIRWNEILKEFPPGFTAQFLRRVTYRCVSPIRKYQKKPLAVIAQMALTAEKNKKNTRRLEHLILNDSGMLEKASLE